MITIIRFTSILLLFALVTPTVHAQHSKREMRAAWIATVANIDWPLSKDNPAKQKEDLIKLLDKLESLNLNTVVFQVRPTADALYYSSLEPWSIYLTGKQGQRPNPYFDPLKFVLEEAHMRFMEVHVWINPYRVLNGEKLHELSSDHIYHKHKDMVVEYGGKYYFNPGLDITRKHLNDVVKDIVERYDIDAIHMDDYFYPYPIAGKEFPDQTTFKKYPRSFTNIHDWRRNNVNMVITELQQTIKSIKPWVELGISPFGVWRNDNTDPERGSATRAGVQNYDDLYADILKWLKDGDIDYVVPQLYWEIGKKVADYAVLVDWWAKNSYGKNLYIGLFTSTLGGKNKVKAWQTPNEIIRQMQLNKKYPEVTGTMHFSAKAFYRNAQGLNDSLQTNLYKYKAICPENANINHVPAESPGNIRVIKDFDNSFITWDPIKEEKGSELAYYVVYAFEGKKSGDLNDPANILCFSKENIVDLNKFDREFSGYHTFVITTVNRYKSESKPMYAVTRRL